MTRGGETRRNAAPSLVIMLPFPSMDARPFLVGGRPRMGTETYVVRSPFDGSVVAEVARPGPRDLDEAIDAARRGFEAVRRLPSFKRSEFLLAASRRLASERERFARTIAKEAGKPLTLARGEVDRAVHTVRFAAEEAGRIGGELIPLDALPGSEGRLCITRRFPVGPVACITPFNFPLNLVAHKVAPALAAGCSFVLKPASQTPSPALDLAALLIEAGFPEEAIGVLPLAGGDATALVEDPRVRAVSFTGSPAVGWDLRRRADRKKVVLELGGNAGVVVDRTADLEVAVMRVVAGGFGYAGQSCISVQRVFAHSAVFPGFVQRLVSETERLAVGDPLDEATTVGPLISRDDACRVEAWILEAVRAGARVLCGGTREGSVVRPTVLTGTTPEMKVCALEVFAPVVVVESFDRIDEAIAAVDRSEFGLQAGIFTKDLSVALAAWEGIEVGALVVNDVPTYRADHMPYGGVKGSGLGREGPRFAIEDYTEMRLLVLAPSLPLP